MDAEKWKSLLLNWIDHTGLIPITNSSNSPDTTPVRLEDTDIRTFFLGFIELLKISSPKQITEFLKVNYPDFELNSSGTADTDINTDPDLPPLTDYMLVYSIFLHYGCITCLDKGVQRTSQSLSAGEQLAVSVFLNHFLYRNVIVTRPALTLAIREAVHSMDAGPLAKFYAEDENGNRPETFTTPKTQKLEANCREIYRLRGQVDTVGFEMSFLDTLLRERDTQIANMKQRECDLQREIESLKKTILYGGKSDYSSSSGEEHRAVVELARKEKAELKQLRKNNLMLEDKVANLLVEVDVISNDKSRLVGKLKQGAKELKAYKERETELAGLIEELNVDLAGKNRQICELEDEKTDLESYISENKSLWNKNIDSMNTSSISTYSNTGHGSMSPNASSSSLLRSNLGSCVIDIQLKEKEMENAELREELNQLRDTSMGMRAGIERFLEENSTFKDQCATGGSVWPAKIPEFFQALTEMLKEKSQLESTVQGQITVMLRFREERDKLSEQLAVQVEKCAGMEKELGSLRETVKNYAETERRELDTFKYEVKHLNDLMNMQKLEKESFKKEIEKGEEDVYAKIRKIAKLNLVIEKLRFEKKKSDNEQKEAEANLNRLWEIKNEELRVRLVDVERRLTESENVCVMRQKHVTLVEEARDQLTKRCEELKVAKEESEKKAMERDEVCRREVSRMKDVVERLEKEAGEMKRDKANLETKLRIVSNNLRPSLSLDVDRMKPGGSGESDSGKEREMKARRSSLRNQLTSTPRLSMKQKVRLDVELMKKRRISLLSPDDDEGGLTSSESDNNNNNGYKTPPTESTCQCKDPVKQLQKQQQVMSASTKPILKVRVGRRDSLIFNSPARKKGSSNTRAAQNASKAVFDRSAINKLQKQKRQKIFNKAREILRESEPRSSGGGIGGLGSQVDSLLWDGQFDMLDLEGGEDFGMITNNEQMQQNFQDILQSERCDGADLFGDQVTPPNNPMQGLVLRKAEHVEEEEEGEQDDDVEGEAVILEDDGRTEVSIERRAGEEDEVMTTPGMLRNSFDRSGASTIQSKSYSMNSGVYWGNERIPTASVVHFSPRRDRLTISPRRLRCSMGGWDLHVIPLSQQNLLQLIAIVLIGILLCIVSQNM